jgi:hypothetical protein
MQVASLNLKIMQQQLPELEILKQLLKDPKNITWYRRVEWVGSQECKDYLKLKIKQLDDLLGEEVEKKDPFKGGL